MSSAITNWIKYELYPVLFERIDQAFPEHRFKRSSRGWRSKTYLDGRPHPKRSDKTVVNKTAPGLILEQGGEVLSLVDYVMQRDQMDFPEALKTLADLAGVEIPGGKGLRGNELTEKKVRIREWANSYFKFCLTHSSRARGIMDYLHSRGYSDDEITEMELGFIPGQEKVLRYLNKKGFSDLEIGQALSLESDSRIGNSHKLCIPYRIGGIIQGFKFRTVHDTTPKYLNSAGLDRNQGLFNISGLGGPKELVLVEGELDALHATVKGIPNVVALGGSYLSSGQVQDALRRNALSFTLCFDFEKDAEQAMREKINRAVEVLLGEGVFRIYVMELPDMGNSKTDPDQFLGLKGAEDFRELIKKAPAYYQFQLRGILRDHESRLIGTLMPARQMHHLLDEIKMLGKGIPDPVDRDYFIATCGRSKILRSSGITPESLMEALYPERNLSIGKEEKNQQKPVSDSPSEASSEGH